MHIFSHSSFIRYLGTLGKNDLLKWITNKVLLYSTGNSAQCYVAAWMGGEFGGEWIYVYASLYRSLCYSSEIIATLFVNQLYTNKQKEKRTDCLK